MNALVLSAMVLWQYDGKKIRRPTYDIIDNFVVLLL